jgi:hypothetical protein
MGFGSRVQACPLDNTSLCLPRNGDVLVAMDFEAVRLKGIRFPTT